MPAPIKRAEGGDVAFDPGKPFSVVGDDAQTPAADKQATPSPTFDPGKPFKVVDEPSELQTFAHSVGASILPSAAGMAGFGTGAAAGAAAGTALFPGPGTAVGGILGGLIGAGAASYGAGKLQDAAISALPESAQEAIGQSEKQRQADISAHPNWYRAGDIAGNLPFMGAGAVSKGARLAGAGLMSAIEGGKQLYQGKFDPTNLGIAAVTGGVFAKPTGLGKQLERVGAAPVNMARGIPAFPEAPAPSAPTGTATGTTTGTTTPTPPGPPPVDADTALKNMQGAQEQVTHWKAALDAVVSSGGKDSPAADTIQARLLRAQSQLDANKHVLDNYYPEVLGTVVPKREDLAKSPEESAADNAKAAIIREGEAQDKAAREGNLRLTGEASKQAPDFTGEDWAAARTKLAERNRVGPLGVEGAAPAHFEVTDEQWNALRDWYNNRRLGGQGQMPLAGEAVPFEVSPERAAELQRGSQQQRAQGAMPLAGEAHGVPFTDEELQQALEMARAKKPSAVGPLGLEGEAKPTPPTPAEVLANLNLLRQQRWAQQGIARPSQPELGTEPPVPTPPPAPSPSPAPPPPPIAPPAMAAIASALQESRTERQTRETQQALAPQNRFAQVANAESGEKPNIPAVSVRGTPEMSYIPSTGAALPVEYAIVDAKDLVTSHHDDLSPNSNYPQALQPRSRERAETEAQLSSILNGDPRDPKATFRPELMGESPDAANGSPIIGQEGYVESGNARTMAIKRAYERGLPQADQYKNYLASRGYPVEGVEQPVLVRINRSGADMAQREQLARDLNVAPQAEMSGTDRAMADAQQVPGEIMRLYGGGDVFSVTNKPFWRGILDRIAKPSELPRLTNPEGGLSAAGQARVRGAILAKAYGEPDIIAALTEDPDNNIKSIGNALMDAAPVWAGLRDDVATGRVDPAYDLTSPLLEAVRLISHARETGRNVAEFMRQKGLFNEGVSPEAEATLSWMLGDPEWTRRFGREKIADALTEYARLARRPEGMLGETKPAPAEIAELAREQAQGSKNDLFAQPVEKPRGTEAVRPSPGQNGAEAQGPAVNPARMATPAGGPRTPERPAERNSTGSGQPRTGEPATAERGPIPERGAGPSDQARPDQAGHDQDRARLAGIKQAAELAPRAGWLTPEGVMRADMFGADEVSLLRREGLVHEATSTDGAKYEAIRPADVLAADVRDQGPAIRLEQGETGSTGSRRTNNDFIDFFHRNGYDPADPRDHHLAAAHYVLERGRDTGNEYAVVNQPGRGPLLSATSDDPLHVSWNHPLAHERGAELVHHHNHPIEFPPSRPDMSTLGYPGIGTLVVHGHDGGTFVARLTPESRAWRDSNPRAPAHIAAIHVAAGKVVDQALHMQEAAGKIDRSDRLFMEPELTNRALAAAGLVEYHSPYGTWPLSESVRDSILRRAAEAATGNARKYGLSLKSGADINANLDHATTIVRSSDIMERLSTANGKSLADAPRAERPGNRAGRDQDRQGTSGSSQKIQEPVSLRNASIPGGPPESSLMERAGLALGKAARGGINEVQLRVAPMARGTDRARAVVKDFLNGGRRAQYTRGFFDDEIRRMPLADQKSMYDTMSKASVEAQLKGEEAGQKIIDTLPPNQRDLAIRMEAHGIKLWEAARQVGIIASEATRIPWFTPRMLLNLAKPGNAEYLKNYSGMTGEPGTALDRMGVNLRTAGPKQRLYLFPEETETAAQAKYGPDAKIIRNIRTLPLAYEQLERAIAGRQLIEDIRRIGYAAGKETVTSAPKPGYFTINNPALEVARARKDPITGEIKRDEDDNVIWDRTPLYISKEFEGPLRAALREEPWKLTQILGQIKAGAMSVLMFSPLIHNIVEYGRALPAMPGKMIGTRVYSEGGIFLRDMEQMRDAVSHGLVPIGHRGYRQDVTGIADEPWIRPGDGMLGKTARVLGDQVSTDTGDMLANAIDKAGNFWHNTLLWNQIAKLQAGLYSNFKDYLINDKGLDPEAAKRVAAHLANRFAGALPQESMSQFATNLANFMLFSRTFTLGNLGVLKDALTGLPRDVQAQIGRDLAKQMKDLDLLKSATSAARKKAIAAVMIDIGLMYTLNAVTQTGFDKLVQDKSWDQISQEYIERFKHALQRVKDNPMRVLNPLNDMSSVLSILPQSRNEPGKEDRILVGKDEHGTAVYARMPLGKIGEEFARYLTNPAEMFTRKEGTLFRPLVEMITNDKGFDHNVYQPHPKTTEDQLRVVWDVVKNFFAANIPGPEIKSAWDFGVGTDRSAVNAARALGPIFGFTISQGAQGTQGGPQHGYMVDFNKDRNWYLNRYLPPVQDMVKAGRIDEAKAEMGRLGLDAEEQHHFMKLWTGEEHGVSPNERRKAMRRMTPEQIWEYEHLNQP